MAAPLGAGVPAGSERADRAEESCGSGRPVLQRERKTMDCLPVQQASMWVILSLNQKPAFSSKKYIF